MMKKIVAILTLTLFVFILQNCEEGPDKVLYTNVFDIEGDFDNNPPNLEFTITPDTNAVDSVFTFDASGCFEPELPDAKLAFRWDFDGDLSWDTDWTFNKITEFTYSNFKSYGLHQGNKSNIIHLLVKAGNNQEYVLTDTIFVNSYPKVQLNWNFNIPESDIIHFDASNSMDLEDSTNLSFRWDFDNDNTWDTDWLGSAIISHKFINQTSWEIQFQVRDRNGLKQTVSESGSILNPEGLIGYYPFNGDANDYSGNANHGIINGATFTQDRNGNQNNALYFDGINDFVDLGTSDILKPENNISIVMIFNFDIIGDDSLGVFTNNWRDEDHKFGFNILINKYTEYEYFGQIHFNLGYPYGLFRNQWCFIVASEWIAGANWWDFNFINGLSYGPRVIDFDASKIQYTASPTYIGRVQNNYYNGVIDEILIFNRELSEEEQYLLYEKFY